MEANIKLKTSKRIIPAKEHVYLDGPKSRGYELFFAIKVLWQFLKGFRTLHFAGPCITVFGSARFGPDSIYYQQAREFGKRIADLGFVTMTGGGPGTVSELLSIYAYRVNFKNWNLGYGAAVAFMVYLVVLILCSIFYKAVYWKPSARQA
jgi:hypothetical protein